MTTNNWFLGACVVFGILAIAAIVAGIAIKATALIVAGAVVLIACVGLFVSGMYDRKHLTPRQRVT